ncbi:MAG: peptidylprolyl isomerase [Bacteriovoracaceae bacterium]|jgi:FKBP-type peptidyl-prolyl cis-trans isomerase SlyD|nr:peptidylprolyl isomerase [Halobacteriovoraceae bacterium]MDP7321680.1 peptidylprolyl isomerase [Bacteriovoracaceae bacterium]|tara:strand:+ start:306 stop:779 length:474 start_codon:yes stop_codon:yes gene_type:complete
MTKQVIGFHYTLKDKDGNVIDSSENATPLLFLEGSGQIIPGLEKEITSLNVGDKKNVEVKAADAYGDVIQDLQITVQKSQFPDGKEIAVGDQFQVNNEPNAPIFTVVGIEDENVHIDGNHPMAGHDLFFDIEITEKRSATEEELAHGHAHGAGGHQH